MATIRTCIITCQDRMRKANFLFTFQRTSHKAAAKEIFTENYGFYQGSEVAL